ncbi:MAG TPA: ISNCY family transposase [Rhabdochlamydiaceae bacterium]|nr:ISNCY family transposase [Rhabdochlamydiaceae bacterium]
MSPQSKKEYLKSIAKRYRNAPKKDKSKILEEFCKVCGYHRKYAISKLNALKKRSQSPPRKRGPKSRYQHPEILTALKEIWIATNLICSKRLKAALPLWIGFYQAEYGYLSIETLKKILQISPATIDRILKPIKHLYRGKGRSATKPGLLLKHSIPIKTNQWDESKPGFLEADTVHHCGTSLAGLYAVTLDAVDIATTWTEQRATYGLGHRDILDQIKDIESSLPFPILGFDSDNGHEFCNQPLLKYLTLRKVPVQFTRSRPYHKNDNAHVESKNNTHVRQWLGYRRFENPLIVPLLNDLYKKDWRLYHNFLIPSVKLLSKKRIASQIVKHHDQPKTPYQRILESEAIPGKTKDQLKEVFKTLNPFKLKKTIDEKIAKIHALAR